MKILKIDSELFVELQNRKKCQPLAGTFSV